jgi:hypothetical protein
MGIAVAVGMATGLGFYSLRAPINRGVDVADVFRNDLYTHRNELFKRTDEYWASGLKTIENIRKDVYDHKESGIRCINENAAHLRKDMAVMWTNASNLVQLTLIIILLFTACCVLYTRFDLNIISLINLCSYSTVIGQIIMSLYSPIQKNLHILLCKYIPIYKSLSSSFHY